MKIYVELTPAEVKAISDRAVSGKTGVGWEMAALLRDELQFHINRGHEIHLQSVDGSRGEVSGGMLEIKFE